MHANPLAEHTINSARTNIAWDKYKTPISILKPPDWSSNNDYKMQENREASLNVQPLTLKVVAWPIHRHLWHSPRTQKQSQHGYLVVVFSRCHKHPTMVGPWGSHLIILHHYLTTAVYLRYQLLAQVNVSANKQTYLCKPRGRLSFSAISATDMCSKPIHFSALP